MMSATDILQKWKKLERERACLLSSIDELPEDYSNEAIDVLCERVNEVDREIVALPAVTAELAVHRLSLALGLKGDFGRMSDVDPLPLLEDLEHLSLHIRHVSIPFHTAIAAVLAGPIVGALIALGLAVLS